MLTKQIQCMGKCCLSVGKGWKPVEAIGAWQRAIGREWGALETVADMWNVQKRVKIYQKCKQWQHCTSTRAELIHWVCESLHPFNIVKDHGFNHLMKTRHPNYCIPSPSMVGHDVKNIFVQVWKQIAKLLQVSN